MSISFGPPRKRKSATPPPPAPPELFKRRVACIPRILPDALVERIREGSLERYFESKAREHGSVQAEVGGFYSLSPSTETFVFKRLKPGHTVFRAENGSANMDVIQGEAPDAPAAALMLDIRKALQSFMRSIGGEPIKDWQGGLFRWSSIAVDTDWHFDSEHLDNFRVLIIQLCDDSPLTTFNLDVKRQNECNDERAPAPQPVCGERGAIGSAVYFADATCHRAPTDISKARLIMLLKILLDVPSRDEDYDRAEAFRSA